MVRQSDEACSTPTAPMLSEDENEKVLVISPNRNGVGKILIREDTVLTNLTGCNGCSKPQFTCAGVKEQWSVLCWGKKQSGKQYYTLLLLLSTTFVLSLIGTVFFCFTNTINDAILSSMVIRNNSLAYKFWRRPNVQPLMKVHLFNYTNWERVKSGLEEKLHVEDVGPFVYSQQLERVNIQFENDWLSYQDKNFFKYLPDKSTGAHFDQVSVPNLPLLGAITKARYQNHFVQLSVEGMLRWSNHPNAFVTLPVHRFLWGYDDDIINLVKPILSLQGQLNFDNFGLLVTKNRTMTDRFTINTGENDINRMNILEKFNGETHLNFWGTSECNSIEASDGSIFPSSQLDKKSALQVFFPNLCRRLPFYYEKEVEISDGIHLLRYRMKDNVFDSSAQNPYNQCYCDVDSGQCPRRGVINVTACAMGAPAMASFPHFLRGDPSLREDITGLKPDPVAHESYLDVHPTLGISLHGKSCLQINIQVMKTPVFSSVSFLKEGLVLPIAWIEMSLEELPDSLRSLVYHGTYSTAAAQLGLIIFCLLTLFITGLCLLCMLLSKRKKPCATVKKVIVDIDTELQKMAS